MNIRPPSMVRLREVILFVVVGISNTGVDFLVLNGLIMLSHQDGELWLLPFNGLAFLAAVINSYIFNGRFTFRNSAPGDRWRFLRFVVVNAVGLFLNTLVVLVLSSPLDAILPRIVAINMSKTLATAVSLCWNYFAIKRWIFRKEQCLETGSDKDTNAVVPVGEVSSADPVIEGETTSAV